MKHLARAAVAVVCTVTALLHPTPAAAVTTISSPALVECLRDATLDPTAYNRLDANHHYVVTGSVRQCVPHPQPQVVLQKPGFWLVAYRHREPNGLAFSYNFRDFVAGSMEARTFGVPVVAEDVGEHGVCFVTAQRAGQVLGPHQLGIGGVSPHFVRHKCYLVTVNAEVPPANPNGTAGAFSATVVPLPLDAPLVTKPLVRIRHEKLHPGPGNGHCGSCF